MNELIEHLNRLIVTRCLQRELYKELENALFDRMFFGGNIDNQTVKNAKVLLELLITEKFQPQFIRRHQGAFVFGWASMAGAVTQCALLVIVYSDGYALRVCNAENAENYDLACEGTPQLNETQLENFKEMLGIRQT